MYSAFVVVFDMEGNYNYYGFRGYIPFKSKFKVLFFLSKPL
jgi:hypothetical protein